jgi:hypothetical protein
MPLKPEPLVRRRRLTREEMDELQYIAESHAKLFLLNRGKAPYVVWTGGNEQFRGDFGHPKNVASLKEGLWTMFELFYFGVLRQTPHSFLALVAQNAGQRFRQPAYIKDSRGNIIFNPEKKEDVAILHAIEDYGFPRVVVLDENGNELK